MALKGMHEMASTHAKLAIENLLHVFALANMHRTSGNDEYRKTALAWFDKIEQQVSAAKADLKRNDKEG